MAAVTHTIVLPDGSTPASVYVKFELVGSAAVPLATAYVTSTGAAIDGVYETVTTNGTWTVTLINNSLITPANTYYRVTHVINAHSTYVDTIQATGTSGTFASMLVSTPAALPDSIMTVHLNAVDPHTRYAADGDGPLFASLPYLYGAITDYNDQTAGALTVVSIGSSVGVGYSLPTPATQAPGAYFTTVLNSKLNKLGNMTLQHYNGCVGGHGFADGPADYATAQAAATGTKVVVPVFFGMNDGQSGFYHSGQTYPGVRTFIKKIVDAARKNHADPILFTTPHPHTGLNTWALTGGAGASSYPANGVQKPDSTTAQSVVTITTATGAQVACSYRHLRVNDMIRRSAAELGVAVIDAERYWFEAVASQGQNNLFSTGETVHPNLLGHQLSYWAAIDHWAKGLENSRTTANTPPTPQQITYDEQYNIQIASPLHLTFADLQYGILTIRAWHSGVAARHAASYLVLGDNNGGTGSGVRIVALGTLAGNVITVSTSGYDVVITPNFNGATIAWTLTNGYPLP